MGCRITDNAQAGYYEGYENVPEILCKGDCDNCTHYYEGERNDEN